MLDVACDPLDLSALEPRDAIYSYDLYPSGASDPVAQARYEVEARGGGRYRTVTWFNDDRAMASRTDFTLAVFGEAVSSAGAAQARAAFEPNALADATVMAAGEDVEIPVRYTLPTPEGVRVEDGVFTLEHLGCTQETVSGEAVLVHRLGVERFRVIAPRNAAPRVQESELVWSIAPSLGWWVAQNARNGRMVLSTISAD